jgi:hypothetical protein
MRPNQQNTNRAPAQVTRIAAEGPRAPLKEASLTTRTDEALKWSGELERHLCAIHANLFGPRAGDPELTELSTIEEKIAALGLRLACLCGFAATIAQRIENN